MEQLQQKQSKTVWDFVHEITPWVWSREGKGGFASKSEKKRWLQNGAVVVNGEIAKLGDLVEFPIHSIVLFPKSKGRVTLC